MTSAELRALQAPLKNRYREDPASAQVTSQAEAALRPGAIQVGVRAGDRVVEAGLHPATGGDGSLRCSGDMLLEALVACSGVTLQAIATAMGIAIRAGRVRAEGDWDARGTLGVTREVPVGFTAVRLVFELESDASREQLAKLLELAERYCVVAQTLRAAVPVTVSLAARS
jgi:uncharacterized OsmC-like protein